MMSTVQPCALCRRPFPIEPLEPPPGECSCSLPPEGVCPSCRSNPLFQMALTATASHERLLANGGDAVAVTLSGDEELAIATGLGCLDWFLHNSPWRPPFVVATVARFRERSQSAGPATRALHHFVARSMKCALGKLANRGAETAAELQSLRDRLADAEARLQEADAEVGRLRASLEAVGRSVVASPAN